jgi:predicted DNA binding CopG/RHH family protein
MGLLAFAGVYLGTAFSARPTASRAIARRSVIARYSLADQLKDAEEIDAQIQLDPELVRKIAERTKKKMIVLRLEQRQLQRTKAPVARRRIPYQHLLRYWVTQGLKQEASRESVRISIFRTSRGLFARLRAQNSSGQRRAPWRRASISMRFTLIRYAMRNGVPATANSRVPGMRPTRPISG